MTGAWVTLATNDSYSLGALVLAHSLKEVGTKKDLVVLITPGVTNGMRLKLQQVFNLVREVNILDSKDTSNLKLLQRPELGITFTKLHCWQLTQYEKCVFLDADTLILQNCDELFNFEELSAAPDVGWPDCFNSGVFVYRPSIETYNSLIQFALERGSFDGGDQGLLNLYFNDWAHKDIAKHLPFIYNVCSTAFYSYLPAFIQFGKNIKIIHFIGNSKPWLQYFDTKTKKVRPSSELAHLEAILQKWWDIFCHMIHPQLSADMSGLAGALAKLTLGEQRSAEQEALEDSLRRQNWEQGNIDYLGRDSFDNIWSKICQTLAKDNEAKPLPTGPAAIDQQQPLEKDGQPVQTSQESKNGKIEVPACDETKSESSSGIGTVAPQIENTQELASAQSSQEPVTDVKPSPPKESLPMEKTEAELASLTSAKCPQSVESPSPNEILTAQATPSTETIGKIDSDNTTSEKSKIGGSEAAQQSSSPETAVVCAAQGVTAEATAITTTDIPPLPIKDVITPNLVAAEAKKPSNEEPKIIADLPESVAAPASSETVAVPATSDIVAAPASSETVAAPASSETVVAPASSETVTAPVSSETVATPASSETVVAPASSETVAAPANSENIVVPVASPETVAAPASSTQGEKNPNSASCKLPPSTPPQEEMSKVPKVTQSELPATKEVCTNVPAPSSANTESCPVVPPPRKSGGNKKQKSKK